MKFLVFDQKRSKQPFKHRDKNLTHDNSNWVRWVYYPYASVLKKLLSLADMIKTMTELPQSGSPQSGQSARQVLNRISTQTAEELFITHKRLARRFTWHRKLFVASRVALVVAVIGVLLYILFAHRLLLQCSPLVFLLALLLPTKGGRERALEHIDTDIGLSYRTALEYEETQKESDNHASNQEIDFSELLLKRAGYRIRNLEMPDLQPWWLPMLVTTLVLSLVPFFVDATPLSLAGRGLFGNNTSQNAANQPLPNQPNQEAVEEQLAATEDQDFDELAEEDAGEVDAQEENDADLENSFEDNAAQPDSNVSEAEGETLSRFLENLKEKEQVEEEEPTSQEAQNRQTREQGAEDGTPDSEAEQAEESAQDRNGEQGEQRGQAQDGSQASEEQADNESEGEQSEQGSEEGQQEQESNEERAGSEEGDSGEDGDEAGARAEEGGRQENDQQEAFAGEENQDGMGSGASEAKEALGERLEGQRQAPELLEGEILSDETTIAGDVRLPGSDRVALPDGSSTGEFDKAVERAIAEGRIPVEYQEILKNYFR